MHCAQGPPQDDAPIRRKECDLKQKCDLPGCTEGLFRGGIDLMKVQRLTGMLPWEYGFSAMCLYSSLDTSGLEVSVAFELCPVGRKSHHTGRDMQMA